MKLRAIFTKYTEDIKKYVSSKLSTSDSSAVHKSGNETIDGVKTFGSQIVGTIDKAEKDKAGNVITETYATKTSVNDTFMPLSGGTLSGNIVPDTTGTRNLGTESAKFKEVWADEVHISQNTLYVGDVPVIGSGEDTIVIKADPDQSIQMKTSGEGLSQITSESGVTISSTGINSNISVSAKGSNASVAIASDKAINITSANVNIDADTTIKNLTVTGTTTTVNTEDLKVKDNVVELNSGETGNGVSKGTSGIKVNRGDALPYLIQFDESDDLFKVGEQGDLETIASRPYVDDAVSPKANDSNVVHKSGNETIAGTKTFSSQIKGNISGTSSNVVVGSDTATARGYLVDNTLPWYKWEEGSQLIAGRVPLITDFNNLIKPGVYHVVFCLNDGFVHEENEYKESLNRPSIPNITTGFRDGILEIKETTTMYNVSAFHRFTQKITLLSGNSNYGFNGRTYQRVCINLGSKDWTAWKRVASDEEVVHTSGNETIAGSKTFSETRTKFFKSLDLYHNEDYKLNKNPSAKAYQYVFFTGKSGWHSAFLENQVDTDGASYCNLSTRNTNEQSAAVQLAIDSNGVKTFKPATNNDISLGASTSKWKAVYANTFNGNLVGNADTATKATNNASGNELSNNIIKGLSVSGKVITYTKLDGSTGTITTQDTNTWTAFKGATSSANGTAGYVPAPTKGNQDKFFKADGTWATPTNTTYSAMSAAEATTGTATTARSITAKVLNDKIDEKISALVASAPETLDTLNELASALGNDPNFATTVATQIGTKANANHNHDSVYVKLSGGTITNNINKVGISCDWKEGRTNAIVKTNATSSPSNSQYVPCISSKSYQGSWELGTYTNNDYYLTYITDADFDAGTNKATTQYKFCSNGTLIATKFQGALVGNSNTTTQFSSNAAVTLTGDVTGTASSKKGWSVAATVKNIPKAATFDITAKEIAAIIV